MIASTNLSRFLDTRYSNDSNTSDESKVNKETFRINQDYGDMKQLLN